MGSHTKNSHSERPAARAGGNARTQRASHLCVPRRSINRQTAGTDTDNMPPPPPPTVGAHAVLRTTHFSHPACDVASFVGGRPPLHAVRLIVCGGGGDGSQPSPRLPPPSPFYAATVPITDLLAPAFIEWAAPGDAATASGVTVPASIDGGGAASLDPTGVLTVSLPGPDWRRLGLGGTRDAGGADVYSVSVRLRSQRAKRDAERKARHCPTAAGEAAPTPAACGGAATAHRALARLAPPAVGVVLLPPPGGAGEGGGSPPPLAGVRTVTPTVATAAVSVSETVDVPIALGLGSGAAPVDADAARAALEFLGAAAARLTTTTSSHTEDAAPPTTLTIDSVQGLLPPEYAVAAVAAARAAVEAPAGETTPAATPWAAVVGVPFPDAPRPLVDGHPPRPCARPDADRAAAWAVVVVGGGACAFVCASGGGDGGGGVF